MVQKYDTLGAVTSPISRIMTCDIYLAAFLLTRHCRLEQVVKNPRQRVSFVIEGTGADLLRKQYRSEPVSVNLRFFRDRLLTLRRLMDGKQRSGENAPNTRRGTESDQE
jgi:hypothetical protein